MTKQRLKRVKSFAQGQRASGARIHTQFCLMPESEVSQEVPGKAVKSASRKMGHQESTQGAQEREPLLADVPGAPKGEILL